MGKDGGFLTPKAIANRIKAKGLQKLRWYCQLCEKQCRDANGFKCHCESEAHQRQVRLFGENAGSYLEKYSREFYKTFVDLLSRRYCSKRVRAVEVYNEHIQDRNHVHMNATKWTTLTSFIQHLGREGIVEVDETEKGFYITYIKREDKDLLNSRRKKEKVELDDQERQQRMLKKQMKVAGAMAMDEDEEPKEKAEFKRDEDGEKIKLKVTSKAKIDESRLHKISNVFETATQVTSPANNAGSKRKVSEIESLMKEEEQRKAKVNRKDYWINDGIIVKIMNKKLADGAYYKKKAKVVDVKDRYIAELEVIETGDVLRLHQDQLETVIPSEGGRVKIVNGSYRGETAEIQKINVDKFNTTVRIDRGPHRDRVVAAVDYEDISKLAA